MIAAIGPWVPLILLCAAVAALAAGALIADAIGSHRLRVDLVVAAIRRGDR